MRSMYKRLLLLLLLIVLGSSAAISQTSPLQTRYTAGSSTIPYVPVSAANSSTVLDLKTATLSNGNLDQGFLNLSIPFGFVFNTDAAFAAVRVYTNGLVQTPRPPGYYIDYNAVDANMFHQAGTLSGYFTNIGPMNMIFGFTTDLDLTGASSGWFAAIQGTTPFRRLVFEWRDAVIKNTTTVVSFQIILSETTNAVDVVYGNISGSLPTTGYQFYTGMNEGTAPVGTVVPQKANYNLAGNYIASRYTGAWEHTYAATSPTAYSSTAFPANQGIRYCPKPTLNTTYSSLVLFDAANNPSDRTSLGLPLTKSFTITNNSTSNAYLKVVPQITGTGAANYSVSPSSVAAIPMGASQTFTVTFNAAALGDVSATIQFNITTSDDALCQASVPPVTIPMTARVLGLSATGSLTINYGAVAVNSLNTRNDVLFHNDGTVPLVYYFTGPTPSTDFQITGATGSPATLTGTVPAGGNLSLPSQFKPLTQGAKSATVNFYYTNQSGTLRSANQTITFTGEGTPSRIKLTRSGTAHLPTGSVFAQSVFGAVGEEPLNFDFTVSNTGQGAPFVVRDFQFYDLDRENPINNRLRVMWTGGSLGSGTPIPSNDFRVQQLLNGEWVTVGANDAVSVPAQQSQQMRVQFVPDRRGINFVRMFFRTDATVDENFNTISALNAADVATPTLQSYDFYGITARNGQVGQIASLLFPPVDIGETSTATLSIRNTGNSRLLIEQKSLHLLDGDKDFTIESAFPGMEVDNGRYVIPVDKTGEIVIRFTPRANGTRLSTLVLMSNDSSEFNGAIGVRYVPITGVGLAKGQINVFAVGTDTNPFGRDTAIVAVPETYREADIEIRNAGNVELQVIDIMLRGLNEGDYSFVTPVEPMSLAVGQSKTVRVRFAPQTGGQKVAEFVVVSSAQNGDQIVQLRGFAGERLVAASTSSLFADDKIAVGEEKSAVVEVRNTGTVALHISPAVLGGANAGDYEIGGSNVEQTIAVGGTAMVPVVLTGGDRGARSATLTVNNNSTNEPVLVVNLGGFVGVRTNTHTPDQISMSSTLLPNGQYEEKEVCVDVENTGDIPMMITNVSLSGAQASQFEADDKANTTIAPGEHATVCVRYNPSQSAAATATLTITTNGAPGTITVPINGIATSVGDGSVAIAGYELEQSRPHPVVESADLGYSLAAGGIVELSLYDATGHLVQNVVSGAYRSAGSHTERVDVRGLESGMYIYRLKVNGYELRSTMIVVK